MSRARTTRFVDVPLDQDGRPPHDERVLQLLAEQPEDKLLKRIRDCGIPRLDEVSSGTTPTARKRKET